MTDDRIDLLHEAIELMPHDQRTLETMVDTMRRALPDATDEEMSGAFGRSNAVAGWQFGFTHTPDGVPLAPAAERWFGSMEQAAKQFGCLRHMLDNPGRP